MSNVCLYKVYLAAKNVDNGDSLADKGNSIEFETRSILQDSNLVRRTMSVKRFGFFRV